MYCAQRLHNRCYVRKGLGNTGSISHKDGSQIERISGPMTFPFIGEGQMVTSLIGWYGDNVTSWRGAPIIVSYMPQYSCTLDASFNRRICSQMLTCTWEAEFSDVP